MLNYKNKAFFSFRFYPDKEMPSIEPVPGNIIDWRFIGRKNYRLICKKMDIGWNFKCY